MSLPRLVSRVLVCVYMLMLAVGVVMLGSIGCALVTSQVVHILPFVVAVITLWLIRFALVVWLHRLGGVPQGNAVK